MRTRKAPPPAPAAPTPPDEGYSSLTVAEVLADLSSLDTEQLMLVKALEEGGEHRGVILDRIGDLLVVQEAALHLRTAGPPTEPAPPAPPLAAPAPPAPPAAAPAPPPQPPAAPMRSAAPAPPPRPPVGQKDVSPDLVDQMGGLLAKDAARKSSGLNTPWAPDGGPAAPVPVGPGDRPLEGKARRKGTKAHRNAPASSPNGHIVPTDGRRSRRGRAGRRGAKLVAGAVVVALVGAGGAVFWKQTHKAKPTSAVPAAVATRDPLLRLLVTGVPAGYIQQPDSVGDTGPSDLAKATRDDGAPDAKAALTAAGFLHGYQRLWSTADKSHDLVVFVYHFRSPAGANSYAQRMVAAAKATAKPAPVAFPLSGIPGAIGLSGTASGTHAAEAFFTRGVYTVQVVAQGPVATDVVKVAQQIAPAQYALLPAG